MKKITSVNQLNALVNTHVEIYTRAWIIGDYKEVTDSVRLEPFVIVCEMVKENKLFYKDV